jgi:hypothetical protein
MLFVPHYLERPIFCYSPCEFLAGRRSVFGNHSISMASLHCQQARTQKSRSALQKLLKLRNLRGSHDAGEGKTGGTLCTSRILVKDKSMVTR